MPSRVKLRISKNRVKSAGKYLRDAFSHDSLSAPDPRELADAIDKLDHWRACHSYPLQKATMGLRSRVGTERCADPRVSQRLKRRPTIIDKLVREPNMQLTTMQDIGGCRGVLQDVPEVLRVQKRWLRDKSRIVRIYDYLDSPKPSGYRGIHIVVQYDGFPIEVQLRTGLQHAWGVAIEQVGPRIGSDLKSGEGPAEVLHLFRVFGDFLAQSEGLPASDVDWISFRDAAQGVDQSILAMIGLEVSDQSAVLTLPT